ncbi:MAG: undecaprenyl-diphosphate phosphatase [Defluviitaleaceae bacterium]|nr:undecaprenyl-diphosphate phosphatase [Defluviitaleaceae bacterium]
MTIFQALILGIVQGIAEFLPISSSGHLAVLQQMFGISEGTLTFNIILHLGSLCAVIAVFWRDIWVLLKNPFQKMTLLLIVGTIPAVAAGFLLRDHLDVFLQAILLAAAFTFTGVLLIISDNIKHTYKTVKEITLLDALIIGFMQAVALPPGISRSGATITGALVTGLNRETAARFSFLLSIIAILGAGVLEAFTLLSAGDMIYQGDIPAIMVGFVAAAISGYFSIRLLLELIKKCKLKYFAYYVFALAALILADYFWFGLFFV